MDLPDCVQLYTWKVYGFWCLWRLDGNDSVLVCESGMLRNTVSQRKMERKSCRLILMICDKNCLSFQGRSLIMKNKERLATGDLLVRQLTELPGDLRMFTEV